MKTFQAVSYADVNLNNGFWQERQLLNRQKSIYSVWDRFEETGRFAAMNMNWREGQPNKPHIFWDSDIAKVLEGAAYILKKHPDAKLESMVEHCIDLIEKHQGEDGYYNIWFTAVEPTQRFTVRGKHELYCAGHLMEAAVAYYEATGKDRFLKCMCKYADYIAKVFMEEESARFETPGHEEIELALVKLYECTGVERYLTLSKWFVDRRGNEKKEFWPQNGKRYDREEYRFYNQSHLPVRNMTTAEGHAVRACYLYCAMADLAKKYQDEELWNACKAIFDNIVNRRMYITGGIGSDFRGEAFTVDYDLPNDTAYNESCAAISLAMFASRMLKLEADSVYADTIERVLYNGFLSSTSLDGQHFFYENPLEINLAKHGRHKGYFGEESERLPITQRVKVFTCSCCPPNIVRFVASIGDMLYTYDDDCVYVHQYMSNESRFAYGGTTVELKQQTKYPVDGDIVIEAKNLKGKQLALRIPGWCSSFALLSDGQPVDYVMENGYAKVLCLEDSAKLQLLLAMEPQLMEANTAVMDCAGKVALQRGPVVYCLEGVDHDAPLSSLSVDKQMEYSLAEDSAYPVPVVLAEGWKRKDSPDGALFHTYQDRFEKTTLRFVPYYTFANRGEMDMRVWINCR